MSSVSVRRGRPLRKGCVVDYTLDSALLVGFVLDMNVGFTGLAIHEWLGIGVGVALLAHLLLHVDWIERITRRIASTAPAREQIRWVVDLALFIGFGLVLVTGVLISEVAISALGSHDRFWRWLHVESAKWVVYLTAAHLALSWRWIVRVTRAILRTRRAV